MQTQTVDINNIHIYICRSRSTYSTEYVRKFLLLKLEIYAAVTKLICFRFPVYCMWTVVDTAYFIITHQNEWLAKTHVDVHLERQQKWRLLNFFALSTQLSEHNE
jgi:hypothetical protein